MQQGRVQERGRGRGACEGPPPCTMRRSKWLTHGLGSRVLPPWNTQMSTKPEQGILRQPSEWHLPLGKGHPVLRPGASTGSTQGSLVRQARRREAVLEQGEQLLGRSLIARLTTARSLGLAARLASPLAPGRNGRARAGHHDTLNLLQASAGGRQRWRQRTPPSARTWALPVRPCMWLPLPVARS